jgi:hypothetical protein
MHKKSYHKLPNKSKRECPTCGWEIGHSHTFENALFGQFSNEKNGDFNASRLTPARSPSIEADVLVPLAQSTITSIQAIISAIPLAIWLQWEWPFLLFIWAGTFLCSWISAVKRAELSQAKSEEFSYSANEKEAGQVAGQGGAGPLQMEIIHSTSGIKNRMQILQLPDQITEEIFGTFLRDILAGRSLARNNWAGTGKPFSRDSYDGMIGKLIEASIIQPTVSGGKILTNGGKHVVKRLVREGVI